MLIDVLVLMVLVDGHPHGTDLRQHHIAETGLDHQVQPRHRIRAQEQFVQLGGHPFRGDPRQLRRHGLHRLAHPRGDREAELRDEPRSPQHPQRIVAERHFRRRRSVEHAVAQCGESAEGIEELRRTVGGDADRHRVDREVPADEVVGEVVPELDVGIARHLVIGVGAKRRDLQPVLTLGDAERAEVDAGVPQRVAPAAQEPQHLIGAGIGGEIQVGAHPAERAIAHTPADEVELMAVFGEETTHTAQQFGVRVEGDLRGSQQFGVGPGVKHVR